ncbi:MAG: NAD-dependent DNA ligase LigA [Candidatus Pacebacteria bacterium]|nr:NAD-dependent DNA ligase LigA [Candidatus Paceibacterota bacterium]
MKPSADIKKRYKALEAEIRRHADLYHAKDAPEISDEAYDALVKEALALETTYPTLKPKKSVTESVGGEASEAFAKVRHDVRQYSFDNVFNREELSAWVERVRKGLPSSATVSFCAEEKIDGLKVILTYKNGVLTRAATRGNGEIGEDITHTVRTIKDVPQKLAEPRTLTAVGEVWLPQTELDRINAEREKKEEQLFVNTRNAAAGSVRQLDPSVTASRDIRTFVYDIDASDQPLNSQEDELKLLKLLGFSVNPHYKILKTEDEIERYYNKAIEGRHGNAYHIDGVVLKVNEVSHQRALGHTAKAPRFGVAYKFPAEQVTTAIEDITLQVGRTGVLTPVAKMKPVFVGGAMVSRATLHNEDFIKELDLRIGDTIVLQRAGDVIPEVVKVLSEFRTGKEKKWSFPKKVPQLCGGDGSIERVPGEAAWRCVHKGSFDQQRRRFEHFAGKHGFDIEGMGKENVKLFLEEGLVDDFDDIFTVTKEDLLALPRFAEKSADNLIDGIEKAKHLKLSRFLVALSINHVGEETARIIAEHAGTLQKLQKMTLEQLTEIDGVGPIVAGSLYAWLRDDANARLLERLLSHVSIKQEERISGGKLTGKTFVLTGTLSSMSRDEAKDLIRKQGGTISSSVSKKTDYVVAGDDPGTKYNEAQKLGVKILTEAEFKKLLA